MTGRKIQYFVIPSKCHAEFAASMEEVLKTYAQPYDPKNPVLCLDEQPVQLMMEARKPIAATKPHVEIGVQNGPTSARKMDPPAECLTAEGVVVVSFVPAVGAAVSPGNRAAVFVSLTL